MDLYLDISHLTSEDISLLSTYYNLESIDELISELAKDYDDIRTKNKPVFNIREITKTGDNYRDVRYTGKHAQVVTMSLEPNEEIGMEVHHDVDQIIYIEEGTAIAILDNKKYEVSEGWGIFIDAGVHHNIINASAIDYLKIVSVYTPPEHAKYLTQRRKN